MILLWVVSRDMGPSVWASASCCESAPGIDALGPSVAVNGGVWGKDKTPGEPVVSSSGRLRSPMLMNGVVSKMFGAKESNKFRSSKKLLPSVSG